MYRCECCGKIFPSGSHGQTTGEAWVNEFGYETIICSDCLVHRTDRAMKVIEANETRFKEEN